MELLTLDPAAGALALVLAIVTSLGSRRRAAVTGDTVGDPFKDTSGPSRNILLTLMAVVAVVRPPFL
jgi:Na+/H+-translocating membrane pyrophosphatase